jgi:hypothetical protein
MCFSEVTNPSCTDTMSLRWPVQAVLRGPRFKVEGGPRKTPTACACMQLHQHAQDCRQQQCCPAALSAKVSKAESKAESSAI